MCRAHIYWTHKSVSPSILQSHKAGKSQWRNQFASPTRIYSEILQWIWAILPWHASSMPLLSRRLILMVFIKSLLNIGWAWNHLINTPSNIENNFNYLVFTLTSNIQNLIKYSIVMYKISTSFIRKPVAGIFDLKKVYSLIFLFTHYK